LRRSISWMSVIVRAVSSVGGPPGRMPSRCFVVFSSCWTLGTTRGMKSVMSLSYRGTIGKVYQCGDVIMRTSGRSKETARWSHHREVLNDSSLGGVSPTTAESYSRINTPAINSRRGRRTRCTRVKITAWDTRLGPFKGMISSGFVCDKSSLSFDAS
jgi:hypothetical protein